MMQAPGSLPDYILSCWPHCAVVVSISRFIQDTGVELCRGLMQMRNDSAHRKKHPVYGVEIPFHFTCYTFGRGMQNEDGADTYIVVLWVPTHAP